MCARVDPTFNRGACSQASIQREQDLSDQLAAVTTELERTKDALKKTSATQKQALEHAFSLRNQVNELEDKIIEVKKTSVAVLAVPLAYRPHASASGREFASSSPAFVSLRCGENICRMTHPPVHVLHMDTSGGELCVRVNDDLTCCFSA